MLVPVGLALTTVGVDGGLASVAVGLNTTANAYQGPELVAVKRASCVPAPLLRMSPLALSPNAERMKKGSP